MNPFRFTISIKDFRFFVDFVSSWALSPYVFGRGSELYEEGSDTYPNVTGLASLSDYSDSVELDSSPNFSFLAFFCTSATTCFISALVSSPSTDLQLWPSYSQ